MARQLHQHAAVQESFAARIAQKVANQREAVQERAEDIPLLGWLLKPLSGVAFDMKNESNIRQGERGEESVLDALLRTLPDSWVIFHNVVVEPRPDEFAQIDLLAIGPAGLFLIETKAWRGSYRAYRDRWQHREGKRWSSCASPTEQVQRQARKLKHWLDQHRLFPGTPTHERIVPTVIFTHAQWLKANECSVTVFESRRELLSFLNAQPAHVLNPAQCQQICDLLVQSPTHNAHPQPVAPNGEPPHRPPHGAPTVPLPPTPAPALPNCPTCGTPMVLRTAQRGAMAGQQFYGCRNYPQCRAILPFMGTITPSGQNEPVSRETPTPAQSGEATTAPAVGMTYRCGACQGEVRSTATYCQHCGARL